MIAIGLDIGGSKISMLAEDRKGKPLLKKTVPIEKEYDAFLVQIFDLIDQARTEGKFTLGISIPGRIYKSTNNFKVKAANLLFLHDKDFGLDLKMRFGFLPKIENDANCFVLSEVHDGAATGYQSVFGLILGTGVGGGFVYNNQIITGRHGIAGEWGHIPMPYRNLGRDGPPVLCGCGQTGCLCPELSSKGIEKRYEMISGQEKKAKDIIEDYASGDWQSKHALEMYFDALAENLNVILSTFDPDLIVIGGGLKNIPQLDREIKKRLGKSFWLQDLNTDIKLAKYDADSGVRGALHLGGNA